MGIEFANIQETIDNWKVMLNRYRDLSESIEHLKIYQEKKGSDSSLVSFDCPFTGCEYRLGFETVLAIAVDERSKLHTKLYKINKVLGNCETDKEI